MEPTTIRKTKPGKKEEPIQVKSVAIRLRILIFYGYIFLPVFSK